MFFSLTASTILVPNSSAQEDTQIPDWIKNVAGWWASGDISENEFLAGIEYLINNNIILLDSIPCMKKLKVNQRLQLRWFRTGLKITQSGGLKI